VFRPQRAQHTQGAGDENWQSDFGLPGADAAVYALARTSTGELYVGGAFRVVGNTAASRIAKWDGTNWSSLGAGLNDTVQALTLNNSGSLYVAGNFTTAGGSAANHIAKWNGSNWQALGTGVQGAPASTAVVRSLFMDGTGTLYAGGSFAQAGGVAAANITRWNGTAWSSLGTGVQGANSLVAALTVVGRNLYVSGSFLGW